MNKPSILNIIFTSFLITFGLCTAGRSDITVGVASRNENRPQVPQSLQVPSDRQIVLKVAAQGSQIYTCRQQPDNRSQFEWTLKAPEAELFNADGSIFGRHYAGPTWEANDGSKIAAVVKVKAASPTKSIPWLLLQVKSTQGRGKLASVKWVQRVHTTGGNSPLSGCDRNRQNTAISVPYTADYYFYSPTKAASN
jgi:hypothetical protein